MAPCFRRLVAPPWFRSFRVALLGRGQRLKGRCPVMQRSADRIMNSLKGDDVVMEGPEAGHAVLHAQDSATGAGRTLLQLRLNFSNRIKFFRQRSAAPCRCGERQFGGGLWWGVWGVWTVSTLWVSDWAVPVPDWAGFRMFRREARVCKGWNPVRVPPRAQCFPCSGAFFVFLRVDSVHTLASDLIFRVCGIPERPIWLCGGVADYGGPRTALWGPFWVFILVRPSVGFSRSPLHGG